VDDLTLFWIPVVLTEAALDDDVCLAGFLLLMFVVGCETNPLIYIKLIDLKCEARFKVVRQGVLHICSSVSEKFMQCIAV
jgi:hypothetical protein